LIPAQKRRERGEEEERGGKRKIEKGRKERRETDEGKDLKQGTEFSS
jgi:hypothetical protein